MSAPGPRHVRSIRQDERDDYTAGYLASVPDLPLEEALAWSGDRVIALWRSIPGERWRYRYREGAWSIRDIAQHMIDVERVFAYRALRFARGDDSELPGFDVDDYALEARTDRRTPEEVIVEFGVARRSTGHLFRSFPDAVLDRKAVASGSVISVRAAGFKLVGHDLHHCEVIRSRYL